MQNALLTQERLLIIVAGQNFVHEDFLLPEWVECMKPIKVQ